MSLLDAYRQKMEAQIQEQKARLDLLKARAKKAAANGKILGYEELAHADRRLGDVKAKFKELATAGSHAFSELKSGMGRALDDLRTSTQKAAEHLKAHAPSAESAAVDIPVVVVPVARAKKPPVKTAPRKPVTRPVRRAKTTKR